MTLTFEIDLDSVEMNHSMPEISIRGHCIQKLLSGSVTVRGQGHRPKFAVTAGKMFAEVAGATSSEGFLVV